MKTPLLAILLVAATLAVATPASAECEPAPGSDVCDSVVDDVVDAAGNAIDRAKDIKDNLLPSGEIRCYSNEHGIWCEWG